MDWSGKDAVRRMGTSSSISVQGGLGQPALLLGMTLGSARRASSARQNAQHASISPLRADVGPDQPAPLSARQLQQWHPHSRQPQPQPQPLVAPPRSANAATSAPLAWDQIEAPVAAQRDPGAAAGAQTR
eukprot:CAMPEP_0170630402 /NCGR_PEP_ID=MMETSP0224-20130122/33969_1 /TAXON_ID=285029 /ORGANISM="Togula jolla, Strain CCCM 725" /LENGTH=129 /DNA_ID=CAMNT_0010958433 /DNA_START=54 /DNA_END=444 /DNA_ORIENTATION=+